MYATDPQDSQGNSFFLSNGFKLCNTKGKLERSSLNQTITYGYDAKNPWYQTQPVNGKL